MHGGMISRFCAWLSSSVVSLPLMKGKITLLFLLLLTAGVAEAKKLYVEMEYRKNSIWLDDGSNKRPQAVKDADGAVLKFRSLIGALNYMSLQGWDFVEAKSITSGSGYVGSYGGFSSTDSRIYYIFCKEVLEEELQAVVESSYRDY